MAWSKEAIEATYNAFFDEFRVKGEGTRTSIEAALTAAAAIDGDFNAGVTACQEYLRSIHHTNTADMLEKLKKVTP